MAKEHSTPSNEAEVQASISPAIALWARWPWLGLPVLIAANIGLRYFLEQPARHFWDYYAAVGITPEFVATRHWWQFLLPMQEVNGGLWAPLTFWVTYFMQRAWSPATTWVFSHVALILIAFWLSWWVLRSCIFSYTLALCLGFGTQLYHIYAIPGGLGHPLLYMYLLFTLFCAYQVIVPHGQRAAWYVLYIISIVLLALSYESWVDFLAFSWLAACFLGVFFWSHGDRLRFTKVMFCALSITLVGGIYIVIKLQVVIGTTNPEIDFIFAYPHIVPALEDFLSNQIFTLYLALTNFLPPFLVSSNALYMFGSEKLVEFQRGYHADKTFLVPMHFLFLWRYYAGALCIIFLYAFVKLVKHAWRTENHMYVVLVLYMLMILMASPSHALYKYRPYYSAPLLTYQVTVGVLGTALLIAYLLLIAHRTLHRRPLAALIVAGTWALIILGVLTRPPYLHEMAKQVGVAYGQGYPDPLQRLIELLRHSP